MNRVKGMLSFVFVLMFVIALASFSSAAINATSCCQKTKTGLFCQDVPQSECDTTGINPISNKPYLSVPTACSSTSYCKLGYCYDSIEGTCADRTPQFVCNMNNGTWAETEPAQCNLGCCILGDQAAFVPLVRCKRLASFLGLQTNYQKNINDEVQCVLTVQGQEKGACVYEQDFETTCKLTTRAECDGGNVAISNNSVATTTKGTFHVGKLCTAEELGTNCGPTKQTVCVPGKDGVYFMDSCGNPANIYDASKLNDKTYWANIMDISEACNAGSANANSAACGNCNYLLGSYCRNAKTAGGATPTYGDNICADLNCKNTQNGQSYKHGESWCVYNDFGTTGKGVDSVGSRFYKHICINGEEVLEQCADFRQEECIQDKIVAGGVTFSQAACRVNRWQDCTAQTNKLDCENLDRRDCYWQNGTSFSFINDSAAEQGKCLPKDPPGLQFWTGDEAKAVCAQGNAVCMVKFEKGLFGGQKATENADCMTDGWLKEKTDTCMNLGDCGPNVNWVGQVGYKPGYTKTVADGPATE